MRSRFKVRDKEYEVVLEKRPRAEEDKFEPYAATVSGQPGGAVSGTLKLTPELVAAAEKKASESGNSSGDLLAHASGRSLAAEVLIRKLKPDFSFIVDHRWLD